MADAFSSCAPSILTADGAGGHAGTGVVPHVVRVAGASLRSCAYGVHAVVGAYGVAESAVVDVALVPWAAGPDHAEVWTRPVSCRHVAWVLH